MGTCRGRLPRAAGRRAFCNTGDKRPRWRYGLNSKIPNPDIPEMYRMSVVLQRQRQLFWVSLVWWPLLVRGGSGDLDVILDQYAVVQYGHMRGARDFS